MYTKYIALFKLRFNLGQLYTELIEFPFVNKEGNSTGRISRYIKVYNIQVGTRDEIHEFKISDDLLLLPPLIPAGKPSSRLLKYLFDKEMDEICSPPEFKRPSQYFYEKGLNMEEKTFSIVINLDPIQHYKGTFEDVNKLSLFEFYSDKYLLNKITLKWMINNNIKIDNSYQEEISENHWLSKCYKEVMLGI